MSMTTGHPLSDQVVCMTRRYGFIVSILLAMLVSLPAFSLIDGTGGSASPPPSRYGFTLGFKSVANPAAECLSVAVGDIDKMNNDDIAVGMQDQIMVLKNNGQSGSSLNFNLYKTISLTGRAITDLELVDYDADSDLDIVALGQQYYLMANDANGVAPSVGPLTVYYIENTGNSFSVETSLNISNVFYRLLNWLYMDGKLDMTTGDFDDDGDIDSAVMYAADTNSNPTNAEKIRLSMFTYSSGSLSSSVIYEETPDFNVEVGFVKAADMDEDGYTDLVFVTLGAPMEIQIMWNTGGDLDSAIIIGEISVSGSFAPPIPFCLDVAQVGGAKWLDIVVGSLVDDDGYSIDGQIWVLRQKTATPRNNFDPPVPTYAIEDSKYSDEYAFRGFAVGKLFNGTDYHIDDIMTFNKVDSDDDGVIDAFTMSALKSQTLSPKSLSEMKFYLPGEIATGHLNAIALGNLDGDPENYDDLVYVGDDITVGPVSWPPDLKPTKQTVVQSPSPVLNDLKQEATFNITIRDSDGAWDLDKAEIVFTDVPGMVPEGQTTRIVTVEKPTWEDPIDSTIGSYIFKLKVPPEVPQGDYIVPILIYGMIDHKVQLTTEFQFRVKQFNRPPIFNVSTPQIVINEDEEITFTGIYDWFLDQDGNEMEIKIKNPKVEGSYLTILDNEMFTATLNMTGSDYHTLEMTVTPKPNKHHNTDGGGGSNKIVLQAFDYDLESEPVNLFVFIKSVNDLARIPADSNNNYEFALKQDDPGFTTIKGTDPYDDDVEGRYLQYSFNYTDPADETWLTCEPEGKVLWNPKNINVGPHQVLLVVNDSYENFTVPFWFNVSNVIDHPYLVSVSNGTIIDLIKNPVKGRLEFVVYEHETFSITVVVDDLDRAIGLQEGVNFQCNLTLSGNTTTLVTNPDNFSATLSFIAEQKYGYSASVGEHKPVDTEILIVDPLDPDSSLSLPIRIRIINVNDRPLPVSIDAPEEGADFPILYNHMFIAGSGMDPDSVYGDNLTYAWDFDASNGDFKEDVNGTSVTWDFPAAGTYKVTLRLIDSGGLYTEASVNVTVYGIKNSTDYDNDGIPNDKELEYGLDPFNPLDSALDKDGDHLTNYEEYLNATDPNLLDTDRDGVADDVDFDPLDKNVWEEPKEEVEWYDDPLNIILLIAVIAIVLILLITLSTLYIIRSRKKSQEEEEKRRLAEEMQKSMYEDQDLYKDLPALQQTGQLAEAQTPALPPSPQGLDDIFGGAGVLPSASAAAPPGPKPPQPEGKADDLTDLLG
jgi:hypothetical protein